MGKFNKCVVIEHHCQSPIQVTCQCPLDKAELPITMRGWQIGTDHQQIVVFATILTCHKVHIDQSKKEDSVKRMRNKQAPHFMKALNIHLLFNWSFSLERLN